MERLSFDKAFNKTCDGCRISYGIIDGSEGIVFIKSGAGGTLRGWHDKHITMAHKLHEKHGFTVICSSNPTESPDTDRAVIYSYVKNRNLDKFQLYLIGTSDGAYNNLILANKIPEAVRLLGINSSFINTNEFAEKLRTIPEVKKLLVYGERDYCIDYVPTIRAADIKGLEIVTIPGADHQFTDMLDEYIALADLL